MKNISRYNSAKRFSSRIILLAVLVIMIIPGIANAAVGDIKSTVEINDSTVNGPVLSDSDEFGTSIASIGDLNGDGISDLAVGAWLDDASGPYRGALHILFMNTDGSIDSTIEINDSTANGPVLLDHDRFGSSVANIGDLNNDGVTDLAVGAPFDNGSGLQRGALHILFMNTDGSIDSTVEINDSTTNGSILTDFDQYGTSIANIGDLDNDGVTDLAVGALGDDNSGTDRGAVHIIFFESNHSLCNIQMSQPIYTAGDTVTASVFRLANQGASPVSVEWKVWLETPSGPSISFINLGADGTFVLPAGFDQDFGPLPLFPAAGLPTGTYELSTRVLNPVTGELLSEDLNVFEVQ